MSDFTHFDGAGRARMVDVGVKGVTHGTAVAGTAVYGDSLAGREWTGVRNGLDLFDGTVIPGNGETIYEDDLVSNIREVMEANHDVAPVWNLSLSVDRDICKDAVSDFGIALDEIQRKHNLLICKSAGKEGISPFGRIE